MEKMLTINVLFVIFIVAIAPSFTANIDKTLANDGTEYWGLLIAVGVYADHSERNIPFMQEDVDDLYTILVESDWWSKDHIKVIKGKNATATNIIQGLRWLDRMDDGDDISLIYITSHGGPLSTDIPPLDEEDGHDECLSTYWSFAYPSTLIWDDELNYHLSKLESQGVCLIIDSCFAGGFNDPPYRARMYNSIKNNNEDDLVSISGWVDSFIEDVSGSGRVVLMACREDEYAIAGMYTPRVIDGLRGFADNNMDGVVSAEEVFYYAETRCIEQHPTMYDGYTGELPIITYNYDQNNNSKDGSDQYDDLNPIMTSKKNNLLYVENSVVCGYITDHSTNIPIENAYVRLACRDLDGNIYVNRTYTDIYGFYRINVIEGDIMFNIYADNYFHYATDWISIGENVTLWLNYSLVHYPPENSVICGFISDKSTGEPIVDAKVNLVWNVNQYEYENYTCSNTYGFYSMNVAAGDIRLYVYADRYLDSRTDWFNIGDDEIFWLNVSLEAFPPEDSIVCGYVTDESTGDTIEDADVDLFWTYSNDYTYWNITRTDHNGFFIFNVASGKIRLRLSKQGYFEVEETYYITDKETLWVNISLFPCPIENSIICGYIRDDETLEPLSYSSFRVDWFDGKGHYSWNSTRTDRYGFYEISVACGELYFRISCDGYNYVRTYRSDVSENETFWFNISLKKSKFRVDIIRPLNAFYIGNFRVIPSSTGVIAGGIDVEAFVHDYWHQPLQVSKLEFYVDGVLKETLMDSPYVWRWDDKTFGMHTLKVVAYSETGYISSDEIAVWKLF